MSLRFIIVVLGTLPMAVFLFILYQEFGVAAR
jgi:hypothetical protein